MPGRDTEPVPGREPGSCEGRLTAPPPGRVPEESCEALFSNEGRLTPDGRVEGDAGTRPPDGRVTPVDGRETAPVDGRETLPVDGRETAPVDGRE